MFTIKHVEMNHEGLQQAREISFYPGRDPKGDDPGGPRQLVAIGVPGPDEGARHSCIVTYASGTVYVMNESGDTIGTYRF